jgi:hypothetical protein
VRALCRDNQNEPGFEAFKGKKLFGAVFGVITTDPGDAEQMEDVLAVGFENCPFELWLHNGEDISPRDRHFS